MERLEPNAEAMIGGGQARRVRSCWQVALVLALVAIAGGTAGAVVRGMGNAFPGDASAEAGFARDMSDHHEQAVEMAILIEERTEDPLVRGLAKDIMLTQQHQRGQMLAWLDLWGLAPTGTGARMAWMGHRVEGRMPGMASPEELATLAGLHGDAADRLFLRLIIRHHEGGVPMARAVLEQTEVGVVRSLAAAIVESQEAEVRNMEKLLAGKAGEPSGTD